MPPPESLRKSFPLIEGRRSGYEARMALLRRCSWLGHAAGILAILSAQSAFAQAPVTGGPPADEAAAVAAPKPFAYTPPVAAPVTDAMHIAISAGGQFQTGNSHLWAATGQGKFDIRRDNDA